jgi:hypothetical protein
MKENLFRVSLVAVLAAAAVCAPALSLRMTDSRQISDQTAQ